MFAKYTSLLKHIKRLWLVKFSYNELYFLKKIELDKPKEYVIFNVMLGKKQTYVCISTNNNKIAFQSTNGVLLKQSGINEKCRKKDLKSNLSLLKNSIVFFLKKLQNKNINIIVHFKKTKPFINKLVKLLLKSVSTSKSKKITLIVNPKISFSAFKFKKLKSIKRRLRKKYKMFDF